MDEKPRHWARVSSHFPCIDRKIPLASPPSKTRYHATLNHMKPAARPLPRSLRLAVSPSLRLLATFATLAALATLPLRAAEPTAEQLAFFENKIRPVLVQKCYSCHSAEAKEKGKLKSGLYVDSREGLLYGGETGPALLPGKPADSLLIKALRHITEDLAMPPKEKLPDAVIADFEKWITQGAPDPRTGPRPAAAKHEINLETGRQWWSFKPLQPVAIPVVKNTAAVRNPIDHFILARQEAVGLALSAPARRETLIRRASFDLTGLPPTPEQVTAFVTDQSPKAFELLIDRLLASTAYGERWARHWLDVVRYAESGGYEFDGFRPGAYHYRDWVIRSFNADLPYDRFLQFQLAGDKLQPGTFEAAAAVGFIVAGPFPGQTTSKTIEKIRYDQLDDIISTLGSGVLGLTLGCVRCHDHKYDPLPQKDYYALAAAFARTVQGNETHDPDPDGTRAALAAHAKTHENLLADLRKFATDEFPARFSAWQKNKLPGLTNATAAIADTIDLDLPVEKTPVAPPASAKSVTTNAAPVPDPRWQYLDILEATANNSFLNVAADGLVVHGGRTKAPPVKRRARVPARAAQEDSFTLTAHTYQSHLTGLRIDAFAEKSLPKGGPGLAGDGSFNLASFTVTAEPLDSKNTNAPVKLKLKALEARFEEKAMPASNAVDADANTSWRAKDNPGKDNAAAFAIDGGFAGFPGGTELTFELHFKNDGFGRFRLALSTAPLPAPVAKSSATKNEKPEKEKPAAPPTASAPIQISTFLIPNSIPVPQHLRELQSMLAAKLIDTRRDDAVRWFSHFDDAAKKVTAALAEHTRQTPRPKLAEVYTAAAGGQEVYLLRRGEVDQKLGKADPGFLQVLSRPVSTNSSAPSPIRNSSLSTSNPSDPRVALAQWLTDPVHGGGSLVARVLVNRIWKHHFGRGLVASPNDFGAKGELPTHPELLDYLANELIRNGWQLKPLHRLVMNSATYQQGAGGRGQEPVISNKLLVISQKTTNATPAALTTNHLSLIANYSSLDPDNRLLWHRPARRLEAEAIRDSLLAVAGRLDPKMFGPSETTAESTRRSVYLRVKRSELIPFLTLFDAPEATASIGDRGATTVPTQALTLLNSPQVRDLATRFAQRALTSAAAPSSAPSLTTDNSPPSPISRLFQIALSRPPTPTEEQRFTAFYQSQLTFLKSDPKPTPAQTEKALAETSLALLCMNEFIYVD